MKRMTYQQKKEALQNALSFYKFPAKYFVEGADARMGARFAIHSKCEDSSGINCHTNYMTYEEFNAWLFGYAAGRENKF